MLIRLLFFGKVKEVFACEQLWMRVPQGSRVGDVVRLLTEGPSGAGLHDVPLVCAVNESYQAFESALSEGDEMAIMTPVCGG